MTPLTSAPWRDLTTDFPAGYTRGGRIVSSRTMSFRHKLCVGVLVATATEDSDALLVVLVSSHPDEAWKIVSETGLTRAKAASPDGSSQVRLFAGLLKDAAEGSEILRFDVIGGGFTAAVTTVDGSVFQVSQAVELGGALLESACVTCHATGAVALARKVGGNAAALWRPATAKSAVWQEGESQPPAAARTGEPGAVMVSAGKIWAAFCHPVSGFEIWTTPWGDGNLAWTLALEHGASKWAANSDVFALASFGGASYAATGAGDLQQKSLAPFHRRAFELLRIYPAGDWDLVVGTPVFTPEGLRAPLSAQGPGFDHLWNDLVLSLTPHDGKLFLLGRDLDTLKLWSSADGEAWESVDLTDLPKPAPASAELTSTPFGLVLEVKPDDVSDSLRLFLNC